MKIRSMQTCIMSSLPHCIFRCSVFRYVTLVSFVFLFKLCYLIVTLLLWWRINTYLLTYLSYLNINQKQSVKVKGVRSLLQLIKDIVPKGLILGLILFDFFINKLY